MKVLHEDIISLSCPSTFTPCSFVISLIFTSIFLLTRFYVCLIAKYCLIYCLYFTKSLWNQNENPENRHLLCRPARLNYKGCLHPPTDEGLPSVVLLANVGPACSVLSFNLISVFTYVNEPNSL